MRYAIRLILTDGQPCYAAKRTDRGVAAPLDGYDWLTGRFDEVKEFDSFSLAHEWLESMGFGFSNEVGFSAYPVTSPFSSWEIIVVDKPEVVK